jgi:16S rRNA (guanine527-N7)-methyltransferase
LDIEISTQQVACLLDYLRQLGRWNRSYNLTAIRDSRQMLVQHLFDSLAVVRPLTDALQALDARAKVYDVGSGGGLPGIVLAIMQPHWQVHCIDAVEKKVAFVRQMRGALSLSNLHAEHARVEQLAAANCALVIARAFASLDNFSLLAGHHVCAGGALVAMKGKIPHTEIQALHARRQWKVEKIQPLCVPQLEAQRCLIWLRRA